jgi:hypothetical protein
MNPMNNHTPPHEIIYDDLVIRLRRQTHWDDSGLVPKDLRSTPWNGAEKNANVFQAEVRQTPCPLQGGAFRVDQAQNLEEFQSIFVRRMTFSKFFYNYSDPPQIDTPEFALATQQLIDLGNKLYELLPVSFQTELPTIFQRSLEQGHGIRLILEARAGDQADRLLSLPWELLFFEATRAYAARTPRLQVVRRLLDAVRQSPVEMAAPYHTVHVIAHSAQGPIEASLQEVERQTLPAAVGADHYTLVAQPGSVEQMLATLQSKPAQIVHFLGHGEFPSPSNGDNGDNGGNGENQTAMRAYLHFVDQADHAQWVTGEQLQHLLSGAPGVQLIVLNACHAGSVAANNIALDLVYSGFPYVVAMQGPVTQEAARHFCRAFYSELQHGQTIAAAVAAGRYAIAAHLPGAIDWCLPVLYTSVGLAEKSSSLKVVEAVEDWFRHPKIDHPVMMTSFVLGGAQLATGVQLWLRGESIPLPDAALMIKALSWLTLMPPLVAWWVWRSGKLPIPGDWSRSTRRALFARMFSAATIGIALPMIYLVWFNVILLTGMGVWQWLPALARLISLELLALGAVLVSYAQARSHGLGFITSERMSAMPFEWGELLMAVAGYALLAIPLLVFYPATVLIQPPYGNLLIGAMTLALAYALNRDYGA